MPEQLSLSLQAFPTVDKDKDSLKYLISRINQQKGSFRNVTEKSLEEEIRAHEAGKTFPDDQNVVETVEEVEDVKTKQEEVTKAREAIIKQIGQAYNDSAQALDFVSLLLSKQAPAAAQTTLSPFLKQTLPLGSLGGEVVQAPQVTDLEKHHQEMVSIGWRMQSLNGAADSLLKSAARLEEEMGRETTYWDHVLAAKEKGWSLSRLPREKHTLGVRYGFAEAYAEFRDRGLAALRRDADGNVNLDRGPRSSRDQTLRVRILLQGKPIASSTMGSDDNSEDDSVTKEILKARNSIFDEELHQELHREARNNLVNQGVRCIGERVLFPYERDKQIEIDLISLDDEDPDGFSGNSTIADAIIISLRILLCHAHRQNHHRRSQIPPPLLESKPPRPIYALLKPIIEHFQHRSQTGSLQRFLQTLHKTLSAANLPFSFTPPTSPHNLIASSTSTPTNDSTISTLLHSLTTPLRSTTTLHLPTATTTTVTIDTHTTLLPPHHSTTHTLTHHPSTTSTTTTTHHTTLPSLTQQILQTLTLSILHRTASTFPPWHAPPTLSHTAALSRTREKSQLTEKASINLTAECLGLRWWRGVGEWRGVSWYGDHDGDDDDGARGHEGGEVGAVVGVGEKRGFDEVFREEVDC